MLFVEFSTAIKIYKHIELNEPECNSEMDWECGWSSLLLREYVDGFLSLDFKVVCVKLMLLTVSNI